MESRSDEATGRRARGGGGGRAHAGGQRGGEEAWRPAELREPVGQGRRGSARGEGARPARRQGEDGAYAEGEAGAQAEGEAARRSKAKREPGERAGGGRAGESAREEPAAASKPGDRGARGAADAQDPRGEAVHALAEGRDPRGRGQGRHHRGGKKHDISRYSIYDWQRKVTKAAEGKGASPTSGPPRDIAEQRDKEILDEWHRHPGLGPSQIRNQLRRKGIKVSVNTARRVMEEAGYRPPKVERKMHDQRYEATRPNHLWHLDFVQRNIHRANTFTLILIDDFSRYVVGHGVDEGAERADLVIAAFEEATARHGRPERVMHDKGSAFWSWKGISRFTALLTEIGIDQVVAEHKEWNGKVEVFNANLHKELFDAHRFYDVAEMRRRLAAHLHWYNHARTHHALGGLLVPADRYYGRVDEVLARIEAGAGRDASDLLDLRERCLELFKVTSKGGVAEVWLLGQRLLELPAGARS